MAEQEEKSNSRLQFILSLLAVVFLTFLNFTFPIFTIAVVIIWPLPVVYLSLKQGQRRAGMMIIGAAIINGLLFSPLMSMVTVVGFGFIGFVMAGALREDLSARKVLILTVVAASLSNLILAAFLLFSLDMGIQQGLTEMVQELADPVLGEEELSPMLEMQLRLLTRLLPAFLIISGSLTGILNYYFVHWFLQVKNFSVETYRSIASWRFPSVPVSLAVVFGLLFREQAIMFNIAALAFFVVFLQGFGLGLYSVGSWTKAPLFRWLYILAVLIIPVLPMILLGIGLIDLWVDLRQLIG